MAGVPSWGQTWHYCTRPRVAPIGPCLHPRPTARTANNSLQGCGHFHPSNNRMARAGGTRLVLLCCVRAMWGFLWGEGSAPAAPRSPSPGCTNPIPTCRGVSSCSSPQQGLWFPSGQSGGCRSPSNGQLSSSLLGRGPQAPRASCSCPSQSPFHKAGGGWVTDGSGTGPGNGFSTFTLLQHPPLC